MINFSVIIPLFNCGEYIKDCLNSILNQTYQNFKIIVVNDGSTDNSLEIAKSVKDERIKIVTKENGGLFHARITGLKTADKDSYIVFVDADDKIESNLLETLKEVFENGSDTAIFRLKTFGEDEKERELESVYSDGQRFNGSAKKEIIKTLFTTAKINSIVCKSCKQSLIETKILENYPRIAIGEDALFTMNLFKNAQDITYIDRPLYLYRQNLKSMSHAMKFSTYQDGVFRFKLQREQAPLFFENEELIKVLDGIDQMAFHVVAALLLSKRYKKTDDKSYEEIINKISDDEFFKELFERSEKKQGLLNKTVSKLVRKKKIKTLSFLRFLCNCLNR